VPRYLRGDNNNNKKDHTLYYNPVDRGYHYVYWVPLINRFGPGVFAYGLVMHVTVIRYGRFWFTRDDDRIDYKLPRGADSHSGTPAVYGKFFYSARLISAYFTLYKTEFRSRINCILKDSFNKKTLVLDEPRTLNNVMSFETKGAAQSID